MKAKKLISAFLILMVITATVFVPSTAYGAEGGGEYKTVKNVPSDSSAEFVTYDTAKFSNDYIKTPNTDIEFFVNATTWEAYRVPSDHGNAGDLTADMLKDVFGITADYSNGFNYTYAAGKLSIYKDYGLTEGENLAVTTQLVNDEFKYMADSQGNNLKDDVDAYVSGGGSFDKLKYTYTSNGVLTFTQKVLVNDPRTTYADATKLNGVTAINDFFSQINADYNTTDATYVDYSTLSEIEAGTYYKSITAEEHAVATLIKVILDRVPMPDKKDPNSKNDIKFRLVSLTDDNGIEISYIGAKEETKPFPDASADSPTPYVNKPVTKAHFNETDYKIETPKYVYNSLNEYGVSYYLLGDSLEWDVTKDTINADFLRAVFPAADEDITKLLAEMDLNPNRAYKIAINSSGHLQITHEEPIPSYEIKWVMDNGDLITTTSVKEGSVPGYTGATPVKEADSQYTYTFDGWTPEITAVTKAAEYKAVFTAKENTYSIAPQSLSWKKGSGRELTITAKQDGDIDRSFEDFTGVTMNGSLLERDKDYKASKGSTIITVSPDALEKLPVGENTLTVQFAFSEASVVINVLEADKLDSPPTGDPVSPFALMSVMALSAVALAMVIAMKKKGKAQ